MIALDEDIKILEEFKKTGFSTLMFKKFDGDRIKTNKKIEQAIEHLIEAYRKAKEEELHWKGQYHLLSRKIDVIPKSKIKEKIEELRNENCDDIKFKYNRIEVNGIIEVILQELLEEE